MTRPTIILLIASFVATSVTVESYCHKCQRPNPDRYWHTVQISPSQSGPHQSYRPYFQKHVPHYAHNPVKPNEAVAYGAVPPQFRSHESYRPQIQIHVRHYVHNPVEPIGAVPYPMYPFVKNGGYAGEISNNQQGSPALKGLTVGAVLSKASIAKKIMKIGLKALLNNSKSNAIYNNTSMSSIKNFFHDPLPLEDSNRSFIDLVKKSIKDM